MTWNDFDSPYQPEVHVRPAPKNKWEEFANEAIDLEMDLLHDLDPAYENANLTTEKALRILKRMYQIKALERQLYWKLISQPNQIYGKSVSRQDEIDSLIPRMITSRVLQVAQQTMAEFRLLKQMMV